MPISNLPVYTGIWPNANTQTDEDYANNTFFAHAWIGMTMTPALNIIIPQFNSAIEGVNANKEVVLATKDIVVAKEALMNPHYSAIDSLFSNVLNINTIVTEIVPNLAEILLVNDNTTVVTEKANEASASAMASVNAKLAAEAILDNFDDRYLGSKSADPTVDNDGNPLTMGAMYYYTNADPLLNKLKVYDSVLAIWMNMNFVPTSHVGLSGVGTKSHDQLESELATKQATLVNQTNIKSINGNNILGAGDLLITGQSNGKLYFFGGF